MIGGATRNKLLIKLTEQRTGLPIEIGECESATVGNFAIQLAASDAFGVAITPEAIREQAKRLGGCGK
jgi:sugar (pentulose or hexulose) kinase